MERLQHYARRAVAARFAAIALPGIALLGALGAIHTFGDLPVGWFDPNGERNAFALVSAGLLAAGAVAALVASSVETRRGRGPTDLLAVILGFMAFDELLQLHEKAESVLGVDWELLYLPLFLAAAILGVLLLARWRQLLPGVLLAGGGLAWAIAAVLEAFEYDGADQRVGGWALMVVIEEPLEMAGAALVAIALLLAAASRQRKSVGPAHRADAAALPVG